MRNHATARAASRVLYVQHLVKQNIFNGARRDARSIHPAIQQNLIRPRIVAADLPPPSSHTPTNVRSWRRKFGCYDPGPNQILLNRRMDRPGVPACAVEYVLYHEMLHVKHPTRRSGCSMVSHSREFREEEKRFAEFERARRILDRLAR